jgi:hypothetical protein
MGLNYSRRRLASYSVAAIGFCWLLYRNVARQDFTRDIAFWLLIPLVSFSCFLAVHEWILMWKEKIRGQRDGGSTG